MGTIECDKSTVTPMLVLSNVMMNYQMWKKNNNGPTKCEKSTVISNVGITQCDDGIVKTWRKKIIVPPNVTKVWLEVMLVLPNVTIELSNVRKKIGYHQMWQKYDQEWCWYYPMWQLNYPMWQKCCIYRYIHE